MRDGRDPSGNFGFSLLCGICHDSLLVKDYCYHARSGFTLLEILLVIALIGLLGGFLLMDWGNLAESFGRRSWKESVEETLRRGHFLAETRDRAVRMRFDPEERRLILEDAESGQELESEALDSVEEIRRLGERAAATSLTRPDERRFFSVRFGRDGSAESILFEVVRESSSARFRNHPFSGRLLEP